MKSPKPGDTTAGFQRFAQALTTAVDMAARRYPSATAACPALRRADRSRWRQDGRPQPPIWLSWPAGRAWAKPRLPPTSPIMSPRPGPARSAPTAYGDGQRRHRWLLLARNVGRTARHPHYLRTGPAYRRTRRGGIDEGDFEKIKDVSIELQSLQFYVDETGGLSVGQLAARARRLKRQRGLDLGRRLPSVLQGSNRRANDSRVQEITEITTRLKALAKELNIPILALSQLSRRSRAARKLELSDLREFGLYRTGRRRRDVRVPRRILPPDA